MPFGRAISPKAKNKAKGELCIYYTLYLFNEILILFFLIIY